MVPKVYRCNAVGQKLNKDALLKPIKSFSPKRNPNQVCNLNDLVILSNKL